MQNITTVCRACRRRDGRGRCAGPMLLSIGLSIILSVASVVRADQPTTAPAGEFAFARALLVVGMPQTGGEPAWKREAANQLMLLTSPGVLRAAVAADAVRKSDWFQ